MSVHLVKYVSPARRATKASKILKKWTAKKGQTAYQLWRLSLVPRGVLHRAIHGGFPSVPHAIRIARAMGMRVEAIWGDDVPRVPNPIEGFEWIESDDDLKELPDVEPDDEPQS